jgi:FdrA protein
MADKVSELIDIGPVVINLGVKDFAESLVAQGVEVVHVEWTPPAGGDREMIDLLDQLL